MAKPPGNYDRTRYSRGGLPPSPEYAGPLEAHKPKGGPDHERTAVPGRYQGPIDPGDLLALLLAVGTLDEQVDFCPADGEDAGTRIKIVHDPQGRAYIAFKVYKDARKVPEWYCIKGMRAEDDPDFEIPDGGGFTIDGRTIELPIDISGGAFTVPAGEESRRSTEVIAGFCETVLQFSNSGAPVGYKSIRIPEGYSGGPLATEFSFYTSAAGAGNASFQVQVRAISGGDPVPAFTTFTSSPTVAVAAVDTRYDTGLSAYFTPAGTPERGDEFQIEIRRNNSVGGNYANTLWLTGSTTLYPLDRATDRPLGT